MAPADHDSGTVDQQLDRFFVGEVGSQYYFGVDGDDTGDVLESLLRRNAREEDLAAFSQHIKEAILDVSKEAQESLIQGRVIFCEGDDLLFRGAWHPVEVARLHDIYKRSSQGRTCSIGVGRTVRAALRGLKLAKSSRSKGVTRGVDDETKALD